jgi:hypothetical protein
LTWYRLSSSRVLQALADDKWRWENGELYYAFDGTVSYGDRNVIRKAVQDLQTRLGGNCVKFIEDESRYHVKVFNPPGDEYGSQANYGYLGWNPRYRQSQQGYQFLRLFGRNVRGSGTIQHEFLHALGLTHTHTRRDRDRYVKLFHNGREYHPAPNDPTYGNKPPLYYAETDFGLSYDYDSLMHYPEQSSAGITIKTTREADQRRIGQRRGPSEGDKQLIREMYKCGGTGAQGSHLGNRPPQPNRRSYHPSRPQPNNPYLDNTPPQPDRLVEGLFHILHNAHDATHNGFFPRRTPNQYRPRPNQNRLRPNGSQKGFLHHISGGLLR